MPGAGGEFAPGKTPSRRAIDTKYRAEGKANEFAYNLRRTNPDWFTA